MEHRFSVEPMEWRSTMDEEGLHICAGPRRQVIRWSDIVGAGMAHLRASTLPADLPLALLPGLNHAAAAAQQMHQCRQVMIAYRPMGRGRRRLKTLAISPDGTGQAAFLSELKARLGSRWQPGEVDYLGLRQRLGFSDWWIMLGRGSGLDPGVRHPDCVLGSAFAIRSADHADGACHRSVCQSGEALDTGIGNVTPFPRPGRSEPRTGWGRPAHPPAGAPRRAGKRPPG